MLFIFQQLPQAFSSVRINLSWIRKKDIQFPSVHFRYPFRYPVSDFVQVPITKNPALHNTQVLCPGIFVPPKISSPLYTIGKGVIRWARFNRPGKSLKSSAFCAKLQESRSHVVSHRTVSQRCPVKMHDIHIPLWLSLLPRYCVQVSRIATHMAWDKRCLHYLGAAATLQVIIALNHQRLMTVSQRPAK